VQIGFFCLFFSGHAVSSEVTWRDSDHLYPCPDSGKELSYGNKQAIKERYGTRPATFLTMVKSLEAESKSVRTIAGVQQIYKKANAYLDDHKRQAAVWEYDAEMCGKDVADEWFVASLAVTEHYGLLWSKSLSPKLIRCRDRRPGAWDGGIYWNGGHVELCLNPGITGFVDYSSKIKSIIEPLSNKATLLGMRDRVIVREKQAVLAKEAEVEELEAAIAASAKRVAEIDELVKKTMSLTEQIETHKEALEQVKLREAAVNMQKDKTLREVLSKIAGVCQTEQVERVGCKVKDDVVILELEGDPLHKLMANLGDRLACVFARGMVMNFFMTPLDGITLKIGLGGNTFATCE
jgi:hypothetical protein